MFARALAANNGGCGGTRASCARSSAGSAWRTSTPSTQMRPLAGSWKRSSIDSTVLLPAPAGPTRATVSPGRTCRVK
ncbi:hypothetical protein G6F64_015609 [Rhizopus arrhizus]|uniref:Uncharacterized protein n=1 Tax=Rhizopus oryzae TaxID=64495 RepID=A0A9P6WQX0_RHIOR|nr:hypothetical protein G6F64_015609 [Rhizopus arrhizus]